MLWARPVVMLVNEVFSKASDTVFGETTLDENLFDTGLGKGKRKCRAAAPCPNAWAKGGAVKGP